jgi:hypothetical protein
MYFVLSKRKTCDRFGLDIDRLSSRPRYLAASKNLQYSEVITAASKTVQLVCDAELLGVSFDSRLPFIARIDNILATVHQRFHRPIINCENKVVTIMD